MTTTTMITCDEKKRYAAQNAREGLITVFDLSVLTGLPAKDLTKLAKIGLIKHHGEYQGKRFFNFQELVCWANEPVENDAARETIRKALEVELLTDDCPYLIEKVMSESGEFAGVRIDWKDLMPQADAA